MGLPGTINAAVYEGLKDVLERQPEVTTVAFEPNSIVKDSLRAEIDPNRVVPPTGPEAPVVDVEWRFASGTQYYQIHYADPNTGFNCGWHCDDDHPKLGSVHFQYENPTTGVDAYEPAEFSSAIPTEVLWAALERLFETHLPRFS